MYKISKEFHFSAAHQLHGLEEGHPCGRLHGHNYVIIVELSDLALDEVGFVEDYGALKDIKEFIDKEWDHENLNDLYPFEAAEVKAMFNPSAENMAKFLFDKFKRTHPKLTGIGVKETPKTIAWYHGE